MSLDIDTLFGIKGRTAVITGGGSGLGEMMAQAWVQNGGHVIIASRKEKALEKVCEKLNALKLGGKAEYVVGDVSSKAGCVALCDRIKEKVKKIHVLVNNSGVTWGAAYENVPEKGMGPSDELRLSPLATIYAFAKICPKTDEKRDLDKCTIGMNVKSIFYMTSELTPLLAKDANNTNPGRVIVISSVAGLAAISESTGLGAKGHGLWSYNASKAAAISLSNNLAVTLGPKFITVNSICPGVFPSKMTAYGIKTGGNALASSHPMGRYGTPEDIAGLFLFLSSRAGAHISANVSTLSPRPVALADAVRIQYIVTDGGSMAAGTGYTKL